jgi:hypothetical protein
MSGAKGVKKIWKINDNDIDNSTSLLNSNNYVIVDNEQIYGGVKNYTVKNSRLNVKSFTTLLEKNNNITKRYIIGKGLENSKILHFYNKDNYKHEKSDICNILRKLMRSKLGNNSTIILAIGIYAKNIEAIVINSIFLLATSGCKIQIWYWSSLYSENYSKLAQKFIDNRITVHNLDIFASTLIYKNDKENIETENTKETKDDVIIWNSEKKIDDILNQYHLRISDYVVWANNNKLCWCKKWCCEKICPSITPDNVLIL